MGIRLSQCEKGSTMVESTMGALVFISILFFSFELFRLSFSALSVQFAAASAIRNIALGVGAPLGRNRRASSIKQQLKDTAKKVYGLKVSNDDLCIGTPACCSATTFCKQNNDAQAPRRLVAVGINYNVPLFFGLGNYSLRGLAIGKNEGFRTP